MKKILQLAIVFIIATLALGGYNITPAYAQDGSGCDGQDALFDDGQGSYVTGAIIPGDPNTSCTFAKTDQTTIINGNSFDVYSYTIWVDGIERNWTAYRLAPPEDNQGASGNSNSTLHLLNPNCEKFISVCNLEQFAIPMTYGYLGFFAIFIVIVTFFFRRDDYFSIKRPETIIAYLGSIVSTLASAIALYFLTSRPITTQQLGTVEYGIIIFWVTVNVFAFIFLWKARNDEPLEDASFEDGFPGSFIYVELKKNDINLADTDTWKGEGNGFKDGQEALEAANYLASYLNEEGKRVFSVREPKKGVGVNTWDFDVYPMGEKPGIDMSMLNISTYVIINGIQLVLGLSSIYFGIPIAFAFILMKGLVGIAQVRESLREVAQAAKKGNKFWAPLKFAAGLIFSMILVILVWPFNPMIGILISLMLPMLFSDELMSKGLYDFITGFIMIALPLLEVAFTAAFLLAGYNPLSLLF